MNPIRIALIGCGAIAQNGYLPALALVPELRCCGLVDVQRGLAEGLAQRWGIPKATDEYRAVLGDVEAVILAVPNHLHAPMAMEAFGLQKAVLCEKPVGRTTEEVRTMVDAARRAGVPLVAGMTLRQYPGLRQVQRKFPWEALGRVREIRASFGYPLAWPLSSPYLFDREKVGGGVLLAEAIHLVDALFWILSLAEVSVEEYWDDGETGVESEAKARLSCRLPRGMGQARCLLEASRVRQLANNIQVVGEKASLLMPLSSTIPPEIHEGGNVRPALERPVAHLSGTQCFVEQLKTFAARIRGMDADCADGESQIRVLALIESCYAARKPLTFPWQEYRPWPESGKDPLRTTAMA